MFFNTDTPLTLFHLPTENFSFKHINSKPANSLNNFDVFCKYLVPVVSNLY